MSVEGSRVAPLARSERRQWRRLRRRAALGLLPGAVTEFAVYQQRLLARIIVAVTILVAVIVLAVAVLIAARVARAAGPSHLVQVRVLRVLEPDTWQPARLPYAVRGRDGYVYDFAFPPHLKAGDRFFAKYDSRNRYLGTVVAGRYSQVRSYRRASLVPLAVTLAGLACALLVLGKAALSARRRTKALEHDRRSPTVEVDGVYEGSWAPTSLAVRAPLARAFPLPVGCPVVLRELETGKRLWLVAPLARLHELKAFEQRLATGPRVVTAAYRPRTGVIERLASGRAGEVDLRPFDDSPPAPVGIVFAP